MKKTAILFPGQGSQYLGMGRAFVEAEQGAAAVMDLAELTRSEERRVGKECRSRWSPYH